MRIWLPDDDTQIVVDVSAQDQECDVYKERFTLTLQQISKPKGFSEDGDHE